MYIRVYLWGVANVHIGLYLWKDSNYKQNKLLIWHLFGILQKELKKQLRELVKERSTVNAVDAFARYAKLNRRIDKIREQLGEINMSNSNYIYKVRLTATAVLYGFISCINFYLIWFYRYAIHLIEWF